MVVICFTGPDTALAALNITNNAKTIVNILTKQNPPIITKIFMLENIPTSTNLDEAKRMIE